MSGLTIEGWLLASLTPLLGGVAIVWVRSVASRVERLEEAVTTLRISMSAITPRLTNIEVLLADLHRKVDRIAEEKGA
jgi:hypothetical protein